jgi:hypothetical protein
MSVKARLKVGSIQGCIAYLRDLIRDGAKTVHTFVVGEDVHIDNAAYQTILRNALEYAQQCVRMIFASNRGTGLDKLFQSMYGKGMYDYLKECLDEAGDDLEGQVHCYLGLLTAVEAITPESTVPE